MTRRGKVSNLPSPRSRSRTGRAGSLVRIEALGLRLVLEEQREPVRSPGRGLGGFSQVFSPPDVSRDVVRLFFEVPDSTPSSTGSRRRGPDVARRGQPRSLTGRSTSTTRGAPRSLLFLLEACDNGVPQTTLTYMHVKVTLICMVLTGDVLSGPWLRQLTPPSPENVVLLGRTPSSPE